jgi:hypothetical protein
MRLQILFVVGMVPLSACSSIPVSFERNEIVFCAQVIRDLHGSGFELFSSDRNNSHRPENIIRIEGQDEAIVNGCDVIIQIYQDGSPTYLGPAASKVISVYSQVELFKTQANKFWGAPSIRVVSDAVFEAIHPGTVLYSQVIAERDEYRQRHPGGGSSKGLISSEFERTSSGDSLSNDIPSAYGVDQPQFKLSEQPRDFAIVVGIEKYSNAIPDVHFSERDAQAMKNYVLAFGVPERNIKFLVGNRATKANLEAYIEDWLPRNVKEDGRVFFYFSGHGAPDPTAGQAYLLPWDGNPNFLKRTAYPLKRLYAQLNSLKAKQVIVALDSCFSGSGGRSVLAQGARPLVTQVDTAVSPGGKLTVFAASAPTEITATLPEQGHGIFTYYFLKGLGGEAKEASGAVTFKGLFDYLKPKVQDAASRQNRDQTPVLEGVLDGEIVRFKQ